MEPRRTRTVLSAALALTVIGVGACGDNSDDKTNTGAGPTSTSAPKATPPKTLAVTGVDYAFEGVPASVASGTTVTLKNTSTQEVHELVALRVKDGDTRPISTLLALPEAERDQAAEFRGVTIAFPSKEGFNPQGPLTLSQPGRYLFVCTIPTGADPVAYEEKAKTAQGPIEVPGGPPHVAKGMVKEVTVT